MPKQVLFWGVVTSSLIILTTNAAAINQTAATDQTNSSGLVESLEKAGISAPAIQADVEYCYTYLPNIVGSLEALSDSSLQRCPKAKNLEEPVKVNE